MKETRSQIRVQRNSTVQRNLRRSDPVKKLETESVRTVKISPDRLTGGKSQTYYKNY